MYRLTGVAVEGVAVEAMVEAMVVVGYYTPRAGQKP